MGLNQFLPVTESPMRRHAADRKILDLAGNSLTSDQLVDGGQVQLVIRPEGTREFLLGAALWAGTCFSG